MYKYYLANYDRLEKRMFDICAKNLEQHISKKFNLEVKVNHYNNAHEEAFDCVIQNTPFVVNYAFGVAFIDEYFEDAPEKEYKSDDEFFADFEKFDRESLESVYTKPMDEGTLVLTKYSKCSLDTIHLIFDNFDYSYFKDTVENEEFDDQEEFLQYCLQKLVYDQE